jgi:hypothetical protein
MQFFIIITKKKLISRYKEVVIFLSYYSNKYIYL